MGRIGGKRWKVVPAVGACLKRKEAHLDINFKQRAVEEILYQKTSRCIIVSLVGFELLASRPLLITSMDHCVYSRIKASLTRYLDCILPIQCRKLGTIYVNFTEVSLM
jgi:hypothetical protein